MSSGRQVWKEEEEGPLYKVQEVGVAMWQMELWDRGRVGRGAVECFWPLALARQVQYTSPQRQRDAGKAEIGGEGAAHHHLHSNATVFWGGEVEEGLMAVSEEPDDVEAMMWDTKE